MSELSDREYNILEDIALGEGAEYIVQEGWYNVDDFSGLETKILYQAAVHALDNFKLACSKLRQHAEGLLDG